MLALLCDNPPRLDAHHPEPQRRPGEALLSLRVAGVCDTDLQLCRGYMGYRGVLGHEFVADVLAADDPALIGRRVVADINAGCGRCAACRDTNGHHCAARSVLGILGRDGAMSERFLMPERTLVPLPSSIADEQAVFAEPLAAALHVNHALQPDPAPIVVLGDGKLGQLIARALLAAGRRTVVVGHHEPKLALCRKAGAETRLECELGTDYSGVPAVIEATGSASGITRALRMVRPKGQVVLKTTVAGKIEVDWSPIVINELQVLGSRCGDMREAVELLARGLDLSELIAARYPLTHADAALAHAARPGTLKVLISA